MFLVGRNILGQPDWAMKKVREIPLKVKRRRSAIPQAYELIEVETICSNLLTYRVFFRKTILFILEISNKNGYVI